MPRELNLSAQAIPVSWLIDRTTAVLTELRTSVVNNEDVECFLVDLRDRLCHLAQLQEQIKIGEMYNAMMEALGDYCGHDPVLTQSLLCLLPDLIEHFFISDYQHFGQSLVECCTPRMIASHTVH